MRHLNLLQGFHSREKGGLEGDVMSEVQFVMLQILPRLANQTLGVYEETVLQGRFQRKSELLDQSKGDELPDARACLSSPQKHNPLFVQWAPCKFRQQAYTSSDTNVAQHFIFLVIRFSNLDWSLEEWRCTGIEPRIPFLTPECKIPMSENSNIKIVISDGKRTYT